MESQGANLLPSSAPLLELIVRLVGVHDVQADSVGALDGGVHRSSLENVAKGVSVQHQAGMETRGAGTRVVVTAFFAFAAFPLPMTGWVRSIAGNRAAPSFATSN